MPNTNTFYQQLKYCKYVKKPLNTQKEQKFTMLNEKNQSNKVKSNFTLRKLWEGR